MNICQKIKKKTQLLQKKKVASRISTVRDLFSNKGKTNVTSNISSDISKEIKREIDMEKITAEYKYILDKILDVLYGIIPDKRNYNYLYSHFQNFLIHLTTLRLTKINKMDDKFKTKLLEYAIYNPANPVESSDVLLDKLTKANLKPPEYTSANWWKDIENRFISKVALSDPNSDGENYAYRLYIFAVGGSTSKSLYLIDAFALATCDNDTLQSGSFKSMFSTEHLSSDKFFDRIENIDGKKNSLVYLPSNYSLSIATTETDAVLNSRTSGNLTTTPTNRYRNDPKVSEKDRINESFKKLIDGDYYYYHNGQFKVLAPLILQASNIIDLQNIIDANKPFDDKSNPSPQNQYKIYVLPNNNETITDLKKWRQYLYTILFDTNSKWNSSIDNVYDTKFQKSINKDLNWGTIGVRTGKYAKAMNILDYINPRSIPEQLKRNNKMLQKSLNRQNRKNMNDLKIIGNFIPRDTLNNLRLMF